MKKILDIIKENLFFIIILIFCTIFIFNFRIIRINGGSMDTTLSDKEIHLARLTNEINRNDIIVANSSLLECIVIKRVIAIPGDTIEIKDNIVYLNGEVLEETYLNEDMITSDIGLYELKENEYFVMGDNRNHSTDSRNIGPIHINDIIGKMII